jgi:multidrug efflux pump subunit AcrB
MVFCVGSFSLLYPFLGQDFFPSVDGTQFELHMRAPTGTRIEDTAREVDEVENLIRATIPQSEVESIVDIIGLPYSGLNTSYSNTGVVSAADADITISLAEKHHSANGYVDQLRPKLAANFPGTEFYQLPVDMTTQILNFGLPAPLDIQVIGQNLLANHAFANKLMNEIKYVPGVVDMRIQQPFNLPRYFVDVDRTKAQTVGLTQKDISSSLLSALSGSYQTSPTFYLDPHNGVEYNVSVEAEQYNLDSLQQLQNIPITSATTTPANTSASPTTSPMYGTSAAGSSTSGTVPYQAAYQMGGTPIQTLGNMASITRGSEPALVTHYNIVPTIDIYGNVDHTDLRSVSDRIQKIVDRDRKNLPRGSRVVIRGQVSTMNSSFEGLLAGLAFSILLVYLLIVVNFQSWLDPFIIVAALPAALSGIVWMLFITGTHISVPALTGSIMCMGVATANSILVVSFAKEQLESNGGDAPQAARDAGYTRFRPVIMTALAMIIGMVPMALGLGDGGEQNAPLGRAVIGGLLFATTATLFFVPTFFSIVHAALEKRKREKEKQARGGKEENDSELGEFA